VQHALFLVAERLLTWCVNPYWRARALAVLGARVGRNVRVYEARFFNLMSGFKNLVIDDDVHIGPGCLIDLTEPVVIGRGAVLSPRTVVLTHSDPGSHHGAELAQVFPPKAARVTIGAGSWIGANSVILCGSQIGEVTVIGAGSLVSGDVPNRVVAAGAPARTVRTLP
jgi:acetyltransferase-like isoleucine patch superfamily enzyme